MHHHQQRLFPLLIFISMFLINIMCKGKDFISET
jgi:hypothetical protein